MLQGGLSFKSKSNMIDLKNNVFHLSRILLQSVDKLNNYFENGHFLYPCFEIFERSILN